MQIDNEFTVGVPVERAWEVLTDLEGIAPCMPGAQLTGVEGDVYSGKVKVRVGPVVSEYAGTARFVEKDDTAHRAVISASGRDSRGAGNASAQIVAQLRSEGERTVVSVDTDLRITGKIAQLGRGMIKEVSTKLLGQFVDCLEGKLTADPGGPAGTGAVSAPAGTAAAGPPGSAADAAPGGSTDGGAGGTAAAAADTPAPATAAAEPASAPASNAAAQERPPLDIMSVAGGSIAKRVVPVVLVVVVLVGLVIYLVAR